MMRENAQDVRQDAPYDSLDVYLKNEQESIAFAQSLAPHLFAPMVMTFQGDIGTGKTTLIRALLKAMGIQGPIKSPTFSLIESYPLYSAAQAITPDWVHHFDLYRIVHHTELDYIGFREYFAPNAICCIEWPERAVGLDADLVFIISIHDAGRNICIRSPHGRASRLMSELKAGAFCEQQT